MGFRQIAVEMYALQVVSDLREGKNKEGCPIQSKDIQELLIREWSVNFAHI